MSGYNPNTSLLPSGNGPIQAMSGGGYSGDYSGGGTGEIPPGFNPTISLLPSAGGDINSYRGGFMNQPIHIIPNETPSLLIGGATIPKDLKQETVTADSIEVSWSKFDPTGKYSGKAFPPATPATPVSGSESLPTLASISAVIAKDKPLATFSGLAPNTEYTIVLYSATSPSDPLKVKTLDNKTKELVPTDENKPKNVLNTEKSKSIILFGTTIELTNPKKMNTDTLSEDQVIALQKFGLDGSGLSTQQKFEIIQALYDGKCNTDQPMIFLQNCEPIRRIIQALALNLLEKLQTKDSEEQLGIKKEDQPSVEYIELDDRGMKICLTFKQTQLGLLSKFAPKTTKKKNKSGPTPPPPPPPPPPTTGSIKPSITETHTATSIIATFSKALKDDKSVDPDVTYKVSLKMGDVNATTNGATSNSKNSEDGKTTTVTFSSLKPNTDYTIEVTATKGSQIETATLPVKTTESIIPPPENNGESSVSSEGSENNGESSVNNEKSSVNNGESSVNNGKSIFSNEEENENNGESLSNGESSVSSEGSEENNGKSSVNNRKSIFSNEEENDGESLSNGESSITNSESSSEEELNNLLAELLEDFEELNLPTNQAKKIDEFKGKELTPEEIQEIDEILASLTATSIPSGSSLTLEQMKAKLEEIKRGMAKNQNKKSDNNLEGGYDIFTTKGIINENPSVSCYCISTIQMLYSIPEIRNAVLNYNCSGLTLDETTINSITDVSIKTSINAKYKEKAKVNEVVDGKMVFCALNKIFEQLNSSTSTFDKLDQTTADTLLDTKGNKKLTNTYVKYIMKIFIAYMNKEIEEKNKKLSSKDPLETINRQQNLTDFLTGFIIPLMENDKTLLPIANIFNFREDTVYTCEQNSTTDPRKKEPTTGITEKIINLGISDYIDNNDIPITNKYKKGTVMFSLDKILDYSQTIESMIDDNALLGCGPKNTTPGAKNSGETKGPGTKRNTYIIPDENRYLLVYTNRPRFDMTTQEKIFNLNEKLFINPEITVNNKLYHIFGSVLYSPGGQERPPQSKILVQAANSSGGHYIYDRFYLADDSKPTNTSSANDLPFVVYNDGRVLFKNTDINIDNKSYLIVYRFVKNLGKTTMTDSDKENINPNIQRNIDERKEKNRKTAENSLRNNSNEQARIKAEQNAIAAKKAGNNAKKAERAKPGPEASVNSQGLFGNITDNNFENPAPASASASAPARSAKNGTVRRPVAPYGARGLRAPSDEELAAARARGPDPASAPAEPVNVTQKLNLPLGYNRPVNNKNNKKGIELTSLKKARNNTVRSLASPPPAQDDGSKQVDMAATPATAVKRNITNKQYTAQNVKLFSSKLSRLQLDLQELQRGKRTPERAAKIQSILSNINALKGETGKNSKTIKNNLTRIQQKYTNINKQKRLTVGGKRNTFKKGSLKGKSITMKKQRK